jgi:hypothetical protein
MSNFDNQIYENTPCVFIQLNSTNLLVLKRQMEAVLRVCAFEVGCVAKILEINGEDVPAAHPIEFSSEVAGEFGIVSSEIPKLWVVKLNSKEEWPKQQAKILSQITKTFPSVERCKDGFTTHEEAEIVLFQYIHVIDQTKEVYDESSEAIASKGESETTLETIYLFCEFDFTSQYSKAPE